MRHPDEAYARYLHDDCLCQVKDKDGKNLIQWGEEWKQQRDDLLAAAKALVDGVRYEDFNDMAPFIQDHLKRLNDAVAAVPAIAKSRIGETAHLPAASSDNQDCDGE